MQLINLTIAPITGYTPTERAEAISAGLWDVTRPPLVRSPLDTVYMFAWKTHPVTGECVLIADLDYVIPVHPQKSLASLLAVMPVGESLTQAEKEAKLVALNAATHLPFGALVPTGSATLTDAQLDADGWNETNL